MYECIYVCMTGTSTPPPAAYVKVWIKQGSELVKYSVGRREAKWLLVELLARAKRAERSTMGKKIW